MKLIIIYITIAFVFSLINDYQINKCFIKILVDYSFCFCWLFWCRLYIYKKWIYAFSIYSPHNTIFMYQNKLTAIYHKPRSAVFFYFVLFLVSQHMQITDLALKYKKIRTHASKNWRSTNELKYLCFDNKCPYGNFRVTAVSVFL